MRNKYFNHKAGTGPGFLRIVSGTEKARFRVAFLLQKNVDDPPGQKMRMVQFLHMKRITVPMNLVFTVHGYHGHVGQN